MNVVKQGVFLSAHKSGVEPLGKVEVCRHGEKKSRVTKIRSLKSTGLTSGCFSAVYVFKTDPWPRDHIW